MNNPFCSNICTGKMKEYFMHSTHTHTFRLWFLLYVCAMCTTVSQNEKTFNYDLQCTQQQTSIEGNNIIHSRLLVVKEHYYYQP